MQSGIHFRRMHVHVFEMQKTNKFAALEDCKGCKKYIILTVLASLSLSLSLVTLLQLQSIAMLSFAFSLKRGEMARKINIII